MDEKLPRTICGRFFSWLRNHSVEQYEQDSELLNRDPCEQMESYTDSLTRMRALIDPRDLFEIQCFIFTYPPSHLDHYLRPSRPVLGVATGMALSVHLFWIPTVFWPLISRTFSVLLQKTCWFDWSESVRQIIMRFTRPMYLKFTSRLISTLPGNWLFEQFSCICR